MEGYFVLDERGEPVEERDLAAWTRWFEQADRSVAHTIVTPEVSVLTTFNGVDHTTTGYPPRLFETRSSAVSSMPRKRGTARRPTRSSHTRRWWNGAASARTRLRRD